MVTGGLYPLVARSVTLNHPINGDVLRRSRAVLDGQRESGCRDCIDRAVAAHGAGGRQVLGNGSDHARILVRPREGY